MTGVQTCALPIYIKVETFYTHPVEFKNGSFNNKTDQDVDVYGVSINKKLNHNHAEVYYFAKDNHDTAHDRASIGLRYYGKSGKLNYDLEGIYQFLKSPKAKRNMNAYNNVESTNNRVLSSLFHRFDKHYQKGKSVKGFVSHLNIEKIINSSQELRDAIAFITALC